MRRTITAYALIVEGKMVFPKDAPVSEEYLIRWFKHHDGKEVEMTFSVDHSRTKAQNNFFHGVIVPATMRVLTILGHERAGDPEYVKEKILKAPYLTVDAGTEDEYVKSTSSLSVAEMWEFCQHCMALILALGGGFNDREQERYVQILQQFGLDDKIYQSLGE